MYSTGMDSMNPMDKVLGMWILEGSNSQRDISAGWRPLHCSTSQEDTMGNRAKIDPLRIGRRYQKGRESDRHCGLLGSSSLEDKEMSGNLGDHGTCRDILLYSPGNHSNSLFPGDCCMS